MAGRHERQSADGRLRVADLFACLARAGRFRDEETAEHVERMSRTCSLIADRLQFSARDCTSLRIASGMHDIGKIGVPDAVLRKPGPLNAEERAMIERHPEIGHQILTGSSDPVMQLAATIALTHHERVDGRGYPRGLTGDRIPLPGRIAAVADVFDALTQNRVYRPALSIDAALSIMREGVGSHFDTHVFTAFEAALPKVLEVRRRYPDSQEDQSLSPPPVPGLQVLLWHPSPEPAGSAALDLL
jgi:HD-GYP domain-containing protein (c-di-GMP phosphodiesterase class II)